MSAHALHGIRVELTKEARQDELERDIVTVLRDHYEDEFGQPADDLLTAALALMPAAVPIARQRALLDQIAALSSDLALRVGDRARLLAIADESYRRERIRTGFALGLRSTDAALRFTVQDEAAIDWLGQETPFWIGQHYDEDLSGVIRRIARDQGLVDGLDVREVGAAFQRILGGTYARTEAYWNLLATNATTRARNFGFVGTADAAGMTEAEVVSVLDGRTSQICRVLNGTVYRVPDLMAQREAMIGATPEEAKEIAAWRKAEDVEGATVEQLVAMGVAIPPYHGNCRTILTVR